MHVDVYGILEREKGGRLHCSKTLKLRHVSILLRK